MTDARPDRVAAHLRDQLLVSVENPDLRRDNDENAPLGELWPEGQ
jgi:hypothetical protein